MKVLGLAEAASGLRSGKPGVRAYAETLLACVRERDATVEAWAALDESQVLALAAACETSAAADAPLRGIPIGVKDIIDTIDWPTARGSAAYAGRRPAQDAVVVQRLKAAGAYVFGKTVTTEFAYMHPGKTRNPFNAAHTPGGSSSGSAAAVAAGMVPAAIGTQTNGSVIRPAAFCGVVGFKPGLGLIPFTGTLQFSATLDQLGGFTRSVADAALLASVMVEGETVSAAVQKRASAPRIAVIGNYPWNRADADAAAHFKTGIARLQAAGATVVPFVLPQACHDAQAVHRIIMFYEAARDNAARQKKHRAQLSATLNAGLDEGRTIPSADYAAALLRRAVIIEQALDWFEDCDAIASLSAPGVAPAGLDSTGDPSWCTLWSLTGFPAITLPSGMSAAGLPYGLQLAAAPCGDDSLLSTALWCEQALAA
ncbi:MAG: amidase [Proteobacteria bacterium]|nr:amidase [Pseudomonadota bacterium]